MASRARRPFWVHQFAEYLMGLVLISLVIQDPKPAVPAAVGLVVVTNAAIVRGPLGAFAGIGRRTHRTLDIAVMVLLVVAAVQPWISMTVMGRAALALILVPFASSWYYTDWDERAARRARRTARGSDASSDLGRRAGRFAGKTWSTGRRALRGDTDDRADS